MTDEVINTCETHKQAGWKSVTFSENYIGDRGLGSVVGIATGYGLDGPGIEFRWGGLRFSAPVQTGPAAHPASCTSTGSFLGVKSDRGMTLTPHLLLVPWSWKGRAIPLLPLWVVRPVQSLSACTRVTITFTLHRRSLITSDHLCSPHPVWWEPVSKITFDTIIITSWTCSSDYKWEVFKDLSKYLPFKKN